MENEVEVTQVTEVTGDTENTVESVVVSDSPELMELQQLNNTSGIICIQLFFLIGCIVLSWLAKQLKSLIF